MPMQFNLASRGVVSAWMEADWQTHHPGKVCTHNT